MTEQNPSSQILALEDRRWAAILEADVAALDRLTADGLRYTHSNGLVDTKQTYLDALVDKTFDYQSEERADVEVVFDGDTALINGRCRFRVIVGQGAREATINCQFSSVWIERDGTWRWFCYQSTPLAT